MRLSYFNVIIFSVLTLILTYLSAVGTITALTSDGNAFVQALTTITFLPLISRLWFSSSMFSNLDDLNRCYRRHEPKKFISREISYFTSFTVWRVKGVEKAYQQLLAGSQPKAQKVTTRALCLWLLQGNNIDKLPTLLDWNAIGINHLLSLKYDLRLIAEKTKGDKDNLLQTIYQIDDLFQSSGHKLNPQDPLSLKVAQRMREGHYQVLDVLDNPFDKEVSYKRLLLSKGLQELLTNSQQPLNTIMGTFWKSANRYWVKDPENILVSLQNRPDAELEILNALLEDHFDNIRDAFGNAENYQYVDKEQVEKLRLMAEQLA